MAGDALALALREPILGFVVAKAVHVYRIWLVHVRAHGLPARASSTK